MLATEGNYYVKGVPGHTHNSSAVISVDADYTKYRESRLEVPANVWAHGALDLPVGLLTDSEEPDNADERLTPWGRKLGLICDERWKLWLDRNSKLEVIRQEIKDSKLTPLIKRSETDLQEIVDQLPPTFDPRLIHRVVTDLRYEGYIVRQQAEVHRRSKTENRQIPKTLDPTMITGLRNEAVDVLKEFQPSTLGQATRLAGITPADVTLIAIAIDRQHKFVG